MSKTITIPTAGDIIRYGDELGLVIGCVTLRGEHVVLAEVAHLDRDTFLPVGHSKLEFRGGVTIVGESSFSVCTP